MPKFTASLNLPKYSSAPSSPTDGDVYYNTTDHKVYSRINGAWVDLGATAAAGSGIPDTIIDAKGDLIVGSSADTPIRLAVGTDGQILAANGSVTGGIEWIDNVAEETRLLIKNETGSTLTKGQVVYINGASGNLPTVALSQANAESTSSKTVGVVRQTITNNSSGYITLSGLLKNVDTQGFTAGQAVWLSAATAGAITATKPTTPNHAVLIGFIPKVDANGEIFVLIQNGFELDELHNVLLTSPASGEWLKYDGTKWVNATLPSASVSATGIVQLSDSTSTTDSTLAATATAVKAAYDRGSQGITDAASALTAANNAQTTANAAIPSSQKGAANGVATLGADSKIPSTQLPAIAITDTFAVNSQANMLALTAETGDVAVRTDINKSFILTASPASTLANWQELLTPTDAVTSVDGATGAVSLSNTYVEKSTVTTAGDLIVANGNASVTRLAAGTANNGKVLKVLSGTPAWDTDLSGAAVYYQPEAPGTANEGDIWIDSNDDTVTATGPQGAAGTNGTSATISVGTTTTGAAGTDASVTNSGTSSAAVFNFTIPQGATGATGATGPAGPAGTSAVYTLSINQQTGTSYTLVLSDADKLIEMNNASANTVTIPLDSTVNFPTGQQIYVMQTGAGQTQIVATAGVTLNTQNGTYMRARWGMLSLIKRSANTWVIVGDTVA